MTHPFSTSAEFFGDTGSHRPHTYGQRTEKRDEIRRDPNPFHTLVGSRGVQVILRPTPRTR